MRYPRTRLALTFGALVALATTILLAGSAGSATAAPQYDISTLAGKVASVNGTAGLQIRFSAFIEQEAEDISAPPVSSPITPTFVPGSPLDGHELQALFDRPPGPWLRRVKSALQREVRAGRLAPDDKVAAAALARRILREPEV